MKCPDMQQTMKCSNCKKSFRRLTTLERHLKLKQCNSIEDDEDSTSEQRRFRKACKIKTEVTNYDDKDSATLQVYSKIDVVSNQALIEKCRKLSDAGKFRPGANLTSNSQRNNSGAPPTGNNNSIFCFTQSLKRKADFYPSDLGSDSERSVKQIDSETDSVESIYEETVDMKGRDFDSYVTVVPDEQSTQQHDKPIYSCTVCGKRYASEKYLSMHISLHQTTASNRTLYLDSDDLGKHASHWVCSVCDKSFLQKSNYKNHLRTHSKLRPFICDVCSIGFKEKYHLKKHILFKHTNELNEKCRICDKRFKDATAVRAHERTHSDLRPYSCNQCGKKFKTSECLWHHEKRSKSCGVKDSANEIQQIVESGSDTSSKKRPVQIILIAGTGTDKDCWSTANVVDLHMLSKGENTGIGGLSSGDIIIDQGDSTELKCEVVCTTENNESNADSVSDQRHRGIAEDWVSAIKPELKNQSKIIKENFEDLIDNGCTVGKSISLSCHSSESEKPRPFKCDLCSLSFKLKAHLKKHNLYRHSNEYLCECDVCLKKFKDSSALQLHKRIHSKERPFSCECGKSFKTKENLWGHRRRKQTKYLNSSVPNKYKASAKKCQIVAVLPSTTKNCQMRPKGRAKPRRDAPTIDIKEEVTDLDTEVSYSNNVDVKIDPDEVKTEVGDSQIAYKHPTILRHLTGHPCVDILDDSDSMECDADDRTIPTLSSFSGQHYSLSSSISSSLCSVFDSPSSSSIEDDRSLSSCADADKAADNIADTPRKQLMRSYSRSLSQEVPQLSLFTDDIQRWADQIGANDLLFDELALEEDDSGISNNVKDDIIGSWYPDSSWNIENNFVDVSSMSCVHTQVA